jgi:hypothetical protein
MIKRLFFLIPVLATLFWISCKEQVNDPQISFENGIDSISEIFPGDLFTVSGQVFTDAPVSGIFYFHQKKDETGKLEETGDRLELDADGSSFALNFIMEQTTVGVKIIAEDVKGNRSVKIFKVIKGIDELEITFDEPGFIEEIESGESFNLKGTVISKTKLTGLNYQIVKGEIMDPPVDIPITNDLEMDFDVPLTAQNGMTGILVSASNKGELTVNELFEIKNVIFIGPIILFDNESIEVKPDSMFTVTGTIMSNLDVASASYAAVRGGVADAAQPLTLTDGRFSFELNAGEDVDGVAVTATDINDNETTANLPVSILFPAVTEGSEMLHFKNIILTDDKFSKTYFSFSLAPYVLNGSQAFDNQSSVNLIYTNCFIADGHGSNGPAVFGPNVSGASTIKANDLTDGWASPRNLSRTPSATDFYSTLGVTFDQIEDTPEQWDAIDTYIKGKIGGSSVVRQYNMSVGYMFAIGFGGTAAGEIDKYAIAIVRGFGGEKATSSGESTGAWVELEIKIRK